MELQRGLARRGRYDGAALRELRKRKGVGRPPRVVFEKRFFPRAKLPVWVDRTWGFEVIHGEKLAA